MSDKKLAILAIVAAVMVILAVAQSYISTGPAEPETPGYLMPAINSARIGSIVLGKGDDTATLKQTEGRFVVVNKENYPAKMSEINDLISKCQQIRWSQFITDNPANHKDLEVTEETARNVVRFLTPEPNSTILAGVIIGKADQTGGGAYVRLLSSDTQSSNKVYLAENPPWINNRAMDYIEQNLTPFKREDINSVTFSSPSGKYTLKTTEDGNDIVLENLPTGKKLKTHVSQSTFNAITNLRFEDVMSKTPGLLFDRKIVCRMKNSVVYTFEIAQKDAKTYGICQAAFTETVERPKPDESQEQLKEKETKLLAWDNAKEFTQKHQGWVYQIPAWKAKNLTVELSDLLEDETKPQEPNEVKAEEPNAVKAEEPNAVTTEQ
jgi:hypothetical protein